MRKTLTLLAILFISNAWGQGAAQMAKFCEMSWTRFVRTLDQSFFYTDEAKRVGDNVLLYQLESGGWGKNINMQAPLTDGEKRKIAANKSNIRQGTIDNGATSTEIRYLAQLYSATGDKRYADGVADGLDYLFSSQYEHGGFPQCYPRTDGYVSQITYNDNANVNVLLLMRAVYEDELFGFLPRRYKKRARRSFQKGVECILSTQVLQDGTPSVWCAQYDAQTMRPAKARAYELVSLSGAESANILNLLMSIEHPSKEVQSAIHHGAAWFETNKIEGIRIESYTNAEGKRDKRVVPCEGCPPLWARFYTIDTNEPFFCDRDSQPVKTLAEIGHERRNGYSWYSSEGSKMLRRYAEWCKRFGYDRSR